MSLVIIDDAIPETDGMRAEKSRTRDEVPRADVDEPAP